MDVNIFHLVCSTGYMGMCLSQHSSACTFIFMICACHSVKKHKKTNQENSVVR